MLGNCEVALQPDRELSCRGMRCPLPVIYTRKALAELTRGQVLRMVATDPRSMDDIVEYTKRSGTELVTHHEVAGECIFVLRKR